MTESRKYLERVLDSLHRRIAEIDASIAEGEKERA